VDDEPLAREKVSLFAHDEPDLEIAAVCSNGAEALSSYSDLRPDLLFLDIQMPEMSGFDLLGRIGANGFPGVIFITAYDEYALRAFEYHAIDYLLKPFDRERFHTAFLHARGIIGSSEAQEARTLQVTQLLASLSKVSNSVERFVVKENGRILFLKTQDIDWMEAAGNYIKLHLGAESHMIRESMANLERQLDPSVFVRIHRSTMINIDRIKELRPWFNGDYKVILHNNRELTMSRGYRTNLTKLLGKEI
jgi:two-component system LytT family response regulator